jgi:hypothetical protein
VSANRQWESLRILAEFAQVSVRKTVAVRIEPFTQVLIVRFPAKKLTIAILSRPVAICRLSARSLHNLLHKRSRLATAARVNVAALRVVLDGHRRLRRRSGREGAIVSKALNRGLRSRR